MAVNYDSPLTGQELDEAFRKMTTIDSSVTTAENAATRAENAAERAETAAGVNPNDYYMKSQILALVPFLYKATFRSYSWSSVSGGYTQTAYVTPVDGGPDITYSSVMTSGLFCDDSVQGDAQESLLEAASIIDKGTKTFGYGTITCKITGDKPTTDAEVYFNARKGGV